MEYVTFSVHELSGLTRRVGGIDWADHDHIVDGSVPVEIGQQSVVDPNGDEPVSSSQIDSRVQAEGKKQRIVINVPEMGIGSGIVAEIDRITVFISPYPRLLKGDTLLKGVVNVDCCWLEI